MLERKIESAEIILNSFETLFGATRKPFKVEEFEFYNEHYDSDIKGVKIAHVEHEDVFCVVAEVKTKTLRKTVADSKVITTSRIALWKPYLEKGESSVGEVDEIGCDYAFEPDESDLFIGTTDAFYKGILSLIQFLTIGALDANC